MFIFYLNVCVSQEREKKGVRVCLLTRKPECHSRTCCGVKPDKFDNSVTSASVKDLPRFVRASVLPIKNSFFGEKKKFFVRDQMKSTMIKNRH